MLMPQTSPAGRRPETAAPVLHLLALVVLLLSVSVATGQWGSQWKPDDHGRHAVILLYSCVVAIEWMLLSFVLWRWPWRPDSRWRRPRAVLADLATAALFSLVWLGVAKALVLVLGPDHWASESAFLPHGGLEVGAWILLAANAAFCEEIIYRGYLLEQFRIRTGSATVAILGQAVLFGASHGYQGLKNMILISVFGVLYGLLVQWRKTLNPGMWAHAGLDIIGGIVT
jgi:membrane protease YdiL (CAAX protease family)